MVVVSDFKGAGAEAKTEHAIPIEGEEGASTVDMTVDVAQGHQTDDDDITRDLDHGAETDGEMPITSPRRAVTSEIEVAPLSVATIIGEAMTSMTNPSVEDRKSTP